MGGGPAGISTALFLSHAAPALTDRIVVLEKATYPREKPCAGGLGARADKLLGSIGVAVDVPSVWLNGVAFRAMSGQSVVRDDSSAGPIGRVVRRKEFDHELARCAMERGIRVVEGARVGSLERELRHTEIETSKGRFQARVVVGADGVGSVVRKSLGLEATRYHAQALEVDTEQVDDDLPRDVILFDASHRELPGYYWDFPTVVDGRELVCRGVYLLKKKEEPAPAVEIQEVLRQELERRGLDLDRCRKKRFAERGFEPHQPVSRPGVLLVGEAAGIDPVTGEGIAQAIFYGSCAGHYIARALEHRDLRFEDWPAAVRGNHVGRDLLVRTFGVDLFYGPRRPVIERFLLANDDFVRVGLQHFAGKRWSRSSVLKGGSGAVWHTLRALLGRDSDGDALRPEPAQLSSAG